ncbi:MAG: T9SS type A sorting domain-containing protein [Ignavibacterium sp.]|nr:MAG: T9SS type A sorting domain-containing protein [Ignavibacterium sp.]
MIHIAGDATFTPVEGMTIPFEIFATDADVIDAGHEGRLQFGYNQALNPWGEGPGVWTFAWIGMPIFTDVENNEDESITSYELFNNYPNPFNPSTNIRYQLPEPGNVSLKVFDVLGREVMELVDEQQAAGSYNINFEASDLASGIYFYRLKAGSYVSIKKMMLLK